MSNFDDFNGGVESAATGAFAVTPSDSADLPEQVRAVTVSGSGTISFIWGGVTYTTGSLPPGTYAMRASRIRATGTTATGLTGWV